MQSKDIKKNIAKAPTNMPGASAGYKDDIAVQRNLEVIVACHLIPPLGILAAFFSGASMLRDCVATDKFFDLDIGMVVGKNAQPV